MNSISSSGKMLRGGTCGCANIITIIITIIITVIIIIVIIISD